MEAVGSIKASVVQRQTTDLLQKSRQNPSVEYLTADAEAQPQNQEPKEVDLSTTEKIAEAIQHYVSSMDVKLNFQVHEGTGYIMVKVINEETGEIIREIPPEQILNLAARIDEMIGTLLDIRT